MWIYVDVSSPYVVYTADYTHCLKRLGGWRSARRRCATRMDHLPETAKQSRKTPLDVLERYVEGNVALFGVIWRVKKVFKHSK